MGMPIHLLFLDEVCATSHIDSLDLDMKRHSNKDHNKV